MVDDNQHTISGVLRKRSELERENVEYLERMAIIANDIEAIDRISDAFGYQGQIEGKTARPARIILFYRNERRQFLQGELAKASAPMSTGQLAEIICQTEGKDGRDRRLFGDVTKRANKALRQIRRQGIVGSEQDRCGMFIWKLAQG